MQSNAASIGNSKSTTPAGNSNASTPNLRLEDALELDFQTKSIRAWFRAFGRLSD
jgi:hypothetical protein